MFGLDEISENLTRHRLRYIMIIVIMGFCLLLLRLGHLQLISAKYYSKRSEGNRLHPVRLIPPRGVMYDRYGKGPIVDNETAYDLCIVPDKVDCLWRSDIQNNKALQRLGLTPNDIMKKLEESQNFNLDPVVIRENVDKDIVAYIAENNSHIPELIIRPRPTRRYEKIASHIIGYTATANEEDLKNGYAMNDIIGRTGIEAEYERYLRGDLGWRMVEVNTFGQVVRDLPLATDAGPGQNLYLTLDQDLQKRAEESLEGKVGAIIALDPRDGGIMAMASKPDFDSNIFMSHSGEERNELLKNPDNPLLNRAIMGKYPPGSTFKIITATAALEEGKINESTYYHCSGSIYIGNRTFRCHKAGGHGSVNIHAALPQSCNVFFYNIAYRAGVTVPLLHKYALMYGLGEKTGVDLPGELRGGIPDKSIYFADKVNMAIGQGAILVTPLQMANVISVIANHGMSYKPHLVNYSKLSPERKPEILVDLRDKVSRETLDLIRNALKNVATHGLIKEVKLRDLQTCGKTGTAQNPHGDEHAWYIGFAPFDNPRIVVAVLVENAGRGSEAAAPIAGRMYAQYFYGNQAFITDNLIAKK